MIKKLIRNYLANILGIIIASRYLPGFSFQGPILLLFETATILTLLNYTLKPLLKLVFLPLILITLGLFTFAVNMLILWLITFISLGVHIATLETLVLATFLFGVLNILLHLPLTD